MAFFSDAAAAGSSPRVRGKHEDRPDAGGTVRIIPACAGQTTGRPWPRPTPPDHPRVCGANCSSGFAGSSAAGSSPRVRGKRHAGHALPLGFRIIPACAGQTDNDYDYRHCFSDHPRVCGANRDLLDAWVRHSGSSPRVRGKLEHGIKLIPSKRIIPACAGQTDTGQPRSPSIADHPRVCGANGPPPPGPHEDLGSSPRVRGKLPVGPLGLGRDRIIPACAGQTCPRWRWSRIRADHPRVCGANRCSRCRPCTGRGSSPRVRGKQSDFMPKWRLLVH